MPYIGNQPLTAAFVTDQFNGNGSTTVFTMSVAPASTSSMLVVVSGIIQDPGTYAINGLTLTFSQAPPSGVGNVSVRYLGIPASGIVNTAYRTVTEMTATPSQTTFNVPSYTAGFINVYRNGVRLAPSDFTATSGVTVVLVNAATSGDSIVTESFYVSSVLNAIPNTAGSVTALNLAPGAARTNWGAGGVLQVVQTAYSTADSTSVSAPSTWANTGCTASIIPSSASNKVLAVLNMPVYHAGTGQEAAARVNRNIGNVNSGYVQDFYAPSGSGITGNLNIFWLDSPATTSALTYTAQFSVYNGGTITINRDFSGNYNGVTYLTLMEIAA